MLAERPGYEAAFVTQIADRDSLTTLIADAARTDRNRLGTRKMPIYTRKPVTTSRSATPLDSVDGVHRHRIGDRQVRSGWKPQRRRLRNAR